MNKIQRRKSNYKKYSTRYLCESPTLETHIEGIFEFQIMLKIPQKSGIVVVFRVLMSSNTLIKFL